MQPKARTFKHIITMSPSRKRAASQSNGDGSNTRPSQLRRSLRPRPHPRPLLGTQSSHDDSTDSETPQDPPSLQDTIAVCYKDMDDNENNGNSGACDEAQVQWWTATVVGVLPVHDSDRIKAFANVSFWPAHNRPGQECSMLFLHNGLVMEAKDVDHRPDNSSNWRIVSRADAATTQPRYTTEDPSATRAERARVLRADTKRRAPPRTEQGTHSSRPRTTSNYGPSGDEHNLHERMGMMEAELRVMKRRQLTELELEVVKEIRVETKFGLIAALRRSHGPLHVREGGQELESVIQAGTIRWTYKCAMGRFKTLAAAAHAFFCEGTNQRPSSIEFNLSFQILDNVSGFGSSEITFRTGMDLLRFLGIATTADMKKLVTYSYEATGGLHLRVLGAMQDGWRNGDPTLAMFVGHSCMRDSTRLAVANNDGAGDADNVFFSNANWDSSNSCFSSEASLQRSPTGYKNTCSTEFSCFKIRWETDPPRRSALSGTFLSTQRAFEGGQWL